MDVRTALDELGLAAGAPQTEVRAAYRRLLRVHHPDVAGAAGADRTTSVIAAYELLSTTGTTPPDGEQPDASDEHHDVDDDATNAPAGVDEPTAPAPATPVPTRDANPTSGGPVADGTFDPSALGEDALAVFAPADETFLLLHDAAGRIGEISYVDRDLGILETMLRFEGGPTCSLVLTLQGRAEYTEVFCTMESIEAAPTPSIAPAVAALVDELQGRP